MKTCNGKLVEDEPCNQGPCISSAGDSTDSGEFQSNENSSLETGRNIINIGADI